MLLSSSWTLHTFTKQEGKFWMPFHSRISANTHLSNQCDYIQMWVVFHIAQTEWQNTVRIGRKSHGVWWGPCQLPKRNTQSWSRSHKTINQSYTYAKCLSAVIAVIWNIIRENYTFSPWEPLYLSSLINDEQISLIFYNKYDLFLPCPLLQLLAFS